MSIRFRCSACFREYRAPRAYVGKRARCRACGNVQRIADPDVSSTSPSAYALEPELVLPPSTPPSHPKPPLWRKKRKLGWPEFIEVGLFHDSQVQGFACGLVALSAADLFMTFTLLRTSPAFFESNPVAHWFFARWNITGMVAFKFSVIAGVIALSEFIERRRPGWGRFVLLIGCVGAAYAVYKGFNLYMSYEGAPPVDGD
jgi:hypothetical protein